MIIYQGCNPMCTLCFGSAATQCTACVSNSSTVYWLSNNTCSASCLTGFGFSTPNTCVLCDKKCSSCYMVSDNCSSCTSSGKNAAYLSTTANSNYTTCVTTCPNQYYANKTARTCDQCNSTCATCLNTANYCTKCATGLYWTGWTCFSTCPVNYFQDTNGINCTKCIPYCNTCNVAYNICTVCTVSGQYQAYLYNPTGISGSCTRVCPAGYSE
jgi:proprotein convertase subtilisin/kexin type 5